MFLGKLTGMDCPDLRVLHCSSNKINTLNLGHCPNLDDLTAAYNLLESLDLSRNSRLHSLTVYSNAIRRLDLSANRELVVLDVSYNQLSKLDITSLERLSILNISHNPIRRLNLSSCVDLQDLSFEGTEIDSLDISFCPRLLRLTPGSKLKYVRASETQRNSGVLEYLNIGIPGPVTIDIIPDVVEEKERLDIQGNLSMEIDIPDPCLRKQLISHADANGDGIITQGEAQALTELHLLDGDDFEYISSLEGLQFFSSLQSFKITGDEYSELKTFDLSPFENLVSFSCYGIPIESLDLSANPRLTGLQIHECALSYLDLTPCPHLVDFDLGLSPAFPMPP